MNRQRGARLGGAGAVVGFGLVILGIHVVHALTEEQTVLSLGFGIVVPILLSLCLVFAGLWIYGSGMLGSYVLRAAGWTIGCAAALCAMGVLTILYQRAVGASIIRPQYVVATLASWGGVTGVVIGLYDVQRRRTEARLVREREKADTLGQQLAVLNRVLRHDVRNGVNVIAGFAELVRSEPELADEHTRRIERKVAELQETSENARRIERMIKGDESIQSIDVVECVDRGVERIDRDYPGATIRADLPEAARVSAHPLVRFAVENVLDNAVEHNDDPDPTVRVSVSPADDDREFVAIRVADDGPGIPRRELAVLEEGRETQLSHASGLGLWLVNWIVTESGGEVEFEEREPRGSVVILRLPADGAEGAE